MAFTATSSPSEIKAQTVKALVLFIVFALLLPISPIWASSAPPTATAVSLATVGETPSTQLEKTTNKADKKNDLTGFFTIGAIINVLFFVAFLIWARKETQKSKKKKTAARQ